MRWERARKNGTPSSRRLPGRWSAAARRAHGADVFEDLDRRVPGLTVEVVFDVGANVGASSLEYRRRFPAAAVYCFEPVSSTFEQLKKNLGSAGGFHPVPSALGRAVGEACIELQELSVNNSLVRGVADPSSSETTVETVAIDTLDAFCVRHRIERIDFLKIDTEGWDLEVLRGGSGMLSGHRVRLVQVEVGMNPYNEKHIPLGRFQEFLEPAGYVLFGLYDQTPEWTGEARLRFCNAVFILSEIAESTRRRHPPLDSRPHGAAP